MPCDFTLGRGERCQLAFADSELETSNRCYLHSAGNAFPGQNVRTTAVQNALGNRIDYFLRKGKPLNLYGAIIPKDVHFNYKKLPEIKFDRTEFFGGDHFKDTTFTEEVNFFSCKFHGKTNFNGSTFTKPIEFDAEIIETDLEFQESTFRESAEFCLATNGKKSEVLFSISTFNSYFKIRTKETCLTAITMKGNIFAGEFSLNGDFNSPISIVDCKFAEITTFKGVARRGFHLEGCEVSSELRFSGFTFNGGVRFPNNIFRADVKFHDAVFGSHILANDCQFEGKVDFSSYGKEEEQKLLATSFRGSLFRKEATFTNRLFTATANFSGCQFWLAPNFHGAQLHQDTRFPGIDAFHDTASDDAPSAYRTLRQLMDKNSCRREEAMFYILEQRALRNVNGAQSTWENAASWIYDKVSCYGTNFWWPIAWMFAALFAFGSIYALWASFPLAQPLKFDRVLFGKGLSFSFQQIVNPFWVWRDDTPDLPMIDWIPWIKVIASVQSLVTTGLFALFLIALRWRFKRD